MSNASDTVDTGEKTSKRSKAAAVDEATPQSKAFRRQHEEIKKFNKENNKVEETWYELNQGHKLVLCKRRGRGSVYRTLIGSTTDKGGSVKQKVAELEKKKALRVRG